MGAEGRVSARRLLDGSRTKLLFRRIQWSLVVCATVSFGVVLFTEVGLWYGEFRDVEEEVHGPEEVWVRAPLFPPEVTHAVYVNLSGMEIPKVTDFVHDVVNEVDRDVILQTSQDVRDAKAITKGLKLYVAPVADHTMNCLGGETLCDNTLGSWDKRLWLFAREAFRDVSVREADFVLMPFFHFCLRENYKRKCFATIRGRGVRAMGVLYLIYNETINHLESLAPGRNWSGRLIVPMSHDFGGCVLFGMKHNTKAQAIKNGQPPMLRDAIVLQSNGDYDEPCFIPGKDIVLPAYTETTGIAAENFSRASQRAYEIYFGGKLKLDTRRPGIRRQITDRRNYRRLDRHFFGYLKSRTRYGEVLSNSTFCLGPPGVVGWSGRVWEALWAGCIPVFLSENTTWPWEEFVDYSKFSLRFPYLEATRLEEHLAKIPQEERDRLQEEGQKVRDMFVYQPPYTQEKGPMAYLFKTLRARKAELDRVR